MTESEVYLCSYDLTEGHLGSGGEIAKKIFNVLPGPELKGIWHSSVIVHGKEIEYGQRGVTINDEGTNPEKPVKKHRLGVTKYSLSTIKQLAEHLGRNTFKKENYNVIKNNCHCFSNILVKNLLKMEIPAYLRNLPNNVAAACFLKVLNLSSHSVPAIRNTSGPEMYEASRQQLASLIEPENGKV